MQAFFQKKTYFFRKKCHFFLKSTFFAPNQAVFQLPNSGVPRKKSAMAMLFFPAC